MNEKEIKRIEEELKNEEIKAYNRVVDYVKQAEEFLKSTNTEFKAEFLKHGKHFGDDDNERDIYLITLKRGNREFRFKFGQSEAESGFKLINKNTGEEIRYSWFNKLTYNKDHDKEKLIKDIRNKFGDPNALNSKDYLKLELAQTPSPYDVLACLTTTNPLTFEDFCSDYGYDTDSRKAERIYKAVVDEFMNLQVLYNEEEINKLREFC